MYSKDVFLASLLAAITAPVLIITLFIVLNPLDAILTLGIVMFMILIKIILRSKGEYNE